MEPSLLPPEEVNSIASLAFSPWALLEALDTLVIVLDTRGRIVHFNDRVERKMNYSRARVLGTHFCDSLISAEEQVPIRTLFEEKLIIFPLQIEQELNHQGKRGRIRWTIIPLHNEAGRITHYVGTGVDITEQWESEALLCRRNRGQELLNRAARTLTSSLDMNRVLAAVLEETRQLLDVSAGSIWLADERTRELICVQASGPQHEIVLGWRLAPNTGIAGWVFEHNQNVIVPDVLENEFYFPNVDRETRLTLRSILCVPLPGQQQIIGVLELLDSNVGKFDANDLLLIEPLAASAAIAIENARLYHAMQQHTREMTMVNHIIQALNATLDTQQVFHVLATELERLFQCDRAWVGLLDLPQEMLILHFLEKQPDLNAGISWPLHTLAWGRDLPQGQLYLDPEISPSSEYSFDRWLVAAGYRTQMVVPLQLGERVIGSLLLAANRSYAFSEQDHLLVQQLAGAVAAALNNALLFEETQHLKTFNEQIVQTMDDGILIVDELGRITFANPKMSEMLKIPPEALLGQYWDFNLEADARLRIVPEVLMQPTLYSGRYEATLITGAGASLPVLISATPIHISAQTTGLLSVVTNMSLRRQAEAVIQAVFKGTSNRVGEAFFESLTLELAATLKVRGALVGELIPENPGWIRTVALCFDHRIVAGRKYDCTGSLSEPIIKRGQSFYSTDLPAAFPHTQLAPEINARSYMGMPLFTQAGQPLGVIAVLHDHPIPELDLARSLLTIFATRAGAELERLRTEEALRTSEARYHAIVEDQLEMVLRFTPDGRLTFANQAFCRFSGYPWEKLQGEPYFSSIIPMEEMDLVLQRLQALTPEAPIQSGENANIDAEGKKHWMRWSNRGIFDEQGRLIEIQSVGLDITQRKQMEEALQEREEQYRLLFETMLNGFALHEMLFDAEGRPCDYRFLEVNSAFEKKTGLTRAQVLGRRILEIIPDFPPDLLAIYGEIVQTGIAHHFEAHIPQLNRYYEINAYSPRPGQFATIFTDITERRVTLAALRESEERLSRIVATAPAGIVILSREGQITFANQRAEEILALERAGNAPRWEITATDGSPLPESELPFSRVLHSGEPVYGVEHAIVHPNGERVILLTNAAPLRDAQGRINGVVTAMNDITARRQAETALLEHEERYRTILETTQDGFLVLGANGRIIDVNEAYIRMTGYSRQELTTMTIHDLDAAKSPEEISQRMEKVITQGWDLFESRHRCKNGRLLEMEISSHYSATNDLALCFVHDLTERKQNQEALLRSERLAAMGRMAAALAHEVNNPLQSIGSSMELVLDFPLPEEEKQEYLQNIRHEIDRLKVLTRRILDFARPARLERRSLQVKDALKSTLALAGKQLQHYRIQIALEIAPDLPPILAAPASLTQVFLNLLINATEAMPQGGQLHIAAQAAGEQVRITFTDSGPGLSAEALQHIYEPFFTTKADGTGLGIPISHSIIQQHGGTMAAENAPEGGARFIITLPVSPDSHPPVSSGNQP